MKNYYENAFQDFFFAVFSRFVKLHPFFPFPRFFCCFRLQQLMQNMCNTSQTWKNKFNMKKYDNMKTRF